MLNLVTKISEFTALHFEQKDFRTEEERNNPITEWVLCELFWLHREKEVRVLVTHQATGAFNVCALTGHYENGQCCNVYHKNRENVVTTAFIGNSLIGNPERESWMYECVPLVDIAFKLSKKANQGWFKFDGQKIELPKEIKETLNSLYQ